MSYTDKQLKILDTAEELFAARGYDGTSVRDIAEASNVNVAMISYYFGSKEKLMQDIFLRRSETLSAKIETLLKDDSLSPFEKIESVIENYLDRIVEKHKFYKLMLCEQSLRNNDTISGLLKEMKMRNSASVAKLIKHGQEKKVFKEDVDVVLLINTLFGTAMHTYIGLDFYKEYHDIQVGSEEELHSIMKTRLTKHIRELYKAILVI